MLQIVLLFSDLLWQAAREGKLERERQLTELKETSWLAGLVCVLPQSPKMKSKRPYENVIYKDYPDKSACINA